MKKNLLILLFALFVSGLSFAQITGTKTIPGDYASIASAITDLNTQGVGTGGVTFNVAANYTETFTTPSDGYITTLTGSATTPIIFQKSAAGSNPIITSAAGVGTLDAIIAIAGCDYVTFDGINLQENVANNTATTEMEWGYAILKASATDGSQNITIKNCTVGLTIAYTATVGIYSNNHTTAAITQLVVTNISGANSNLKIYSNTITNCYSGISLTGYSDAVSPYAFYDQNNEIGKDGANTITNIAGQTVTPAVAGYGIYGKAQNNIKVVNNTITSTMGGNGSPSGIYLTGATNGSYDITGNYVSLKFSGLGTVALNAIFSDMGATGTTNTMNIYNNTVSGCLYSSMTSGAAYMISAQNLGKTINVYSNQITNNSFGGAVTATGTIRYLYCNASPTTLGPVELHDNVVSGNSRTQSVAGGGGTNFIYMTGKGASLNMYNNLVTNNVVSSNGGTYLLYAGFDIGTQDVHDNIATNISKAEGTTYGLSYYNATAGSGLCRYYRNTIQNIEGLTAGAYINGLYLAGSQTAYFYNNIVGDFRLPAATGTTTVPDKMYGCYTGSSLVFVGLYNNTIYLNNTTTGANFGSAAVYIQGSSTKSDLRNNILVNTSTPTGTGRTLALRFNTTALTNYQAPSNYNNLYAGSPDATHCIFYNGTTVYQTLTDFKILFYPRELQSVSELPPFVNSTAGLMNLHLQTAVATQCESGGFPVSSPISITTDFDNNQRYPNAGYPVNGSFSPNAPDIGADEFGGLPNDISGPSITYTNLGQTYITTNRTLTASITDGSGVPTTGLGLPVLYWKINSGSWQNVQASWVSGSTYTFSFGAGTTIGDIVSYYIVAQDNATVPNASSWPAYGASGFTLSPPACSVLPSPQFTYTILSGISGSYHVGVGKDYTTLTAAAMDISTKYITGPLTLILDDATYPSESYPIYLNSNPGSSATNTLTIRPNTDVSPVFSAEVATGLFNLNGIDYLTIDGSNRGGNSKDLTISNPKPVFGGTYALAFLNNGGSDPATNITIKNCILRAVPVHTTTSNVTTIKFDNAAGGFSNCIIDNNTIMGGFTGITLTGTATNKITNCQIINNIIGSTDSLTAITQTGIYMSYCDNTLVRNNEIMGPITGSLNIGQTGVNINTGASNSKIQNNRIHTFWRYSDDGWGASGLWFATAESSTVTEISNNVIYDIHSPGVNPGVGQNITYGMFFRNGGNVKILHNSINLTGAYMSTAAVWDASSACIGFYYQATGGNFEVRNNILRNGSTTLGGGAAGYGKAYGIMISLAPTMFSIINNNDYFIDGSNGQIAQDFTGNNIVNYPTLASWQAFTGQEANSVTVDPVFTSPTNMLPTTTLMNNAGSYTTLVPNDILGTVRSNPPDIGAYEYTLDQVVVTSNATAIGYNSASLTGMINAANYTVNSFFDYGTTTAYGTSVAATPSQVTGTLNTSISQTISGLLPSTTYHFRARGVTTTGLTVYGDDMSFTTAAASLVTFNVDMSTAAGFTPGTDLVFMAGNFPGAVWNEPGTNLSLMMSQVGSTLIYTLNMTLPDGTYEYKYFKNAGWSGGEYAGGSNRSATISTSTVINDTWGGSISWANLQWPATGSINLGDAYDVYAQAYIPNGITAAAGATFGLQAWIGYSTSNTDPSTWTNWVAAPFSGQAYDNDEFNADLGTTLTSAGIYYYASKFQFGTGTIVYGGFNGGYWNGTTNISGILTVTEATKVLNLKLFLQGLYAGAGSMNKAQGSAGDQFPGTTADQVTVELHNATTGALVYSLNNMDLSTSGDITGTVPAVHNGSYYIYILQRNHVKTSSVNPVSFAGSIVSYDFSTGTVQAFGSNMKDEGGVALLYGGDENQDGNVESTDMIDCDNDGAVFASGYLNTDINGDGVVDSSDMIIIDNNNASFVGSVLPF